VSNLVKPKKQTF